MKRSLLSNVFRSHLFRLYLSFLIISMQFLISHYLIIQSYIHAIKTVKCEEVWVEGHNETYSNRDLMYDGETYWVDGHHKTECSNDSNFDGWMFYMMLPIFDIFWVLQFGYEAPADLNSRINSISGFTSHYIVLPTIILRTIVVWILYFLDYFFPSILPI